MTGADRHIRRRGNRVVLALFVGLLPFPAGCASSSSAKQKTVAIDLDHDKSHPLNDAQLQALVMGMADSFGSGIIQVASMLEAEAATPEDRSIAHGFKYFAWVAATAIAAGPSPEAGLIDLLVLVRMQPVATERRLGWADVSPQMADHTADYLAALRNIERIIWQDADRVLTEQQQEQLRIVVDEWLEEHPVAVATDFIRLSDFTEIRNPRSAEIVRGMLADVGNATRAVDDARLLGERALWLGSRMPLMMGFQVEHTLYDVVAQKEARQLIDDSTRFTDAAAAIRQEIATLPEKIGAEREALVADFERLQGNTVDNLMSRIAEERQAFLAEIDQRERGAREVLGDLQVTIDAAHRLVESIDVVVSRFDAGETPNRKPLDMADVRDAAAEAAAAADEFTELLVVTQDLLASPAWQQRTSEIGSAWGRVEEGGHDWISHGFRQSLVVVLAGFVALVLYRIIAVKLIK